MRRLKPRTGEASPPLNGSTVTSTAPISLRSLIIVSEWGALIKIAPATKRFPAMYAIYLLRHNSRRPVLATPTPSEARIKRLRQQLNLTKSTRKDRPRWMFKGDDNIEVARADLENRFKYYNHQFLLKALDGFK